MGWILPTIFCTACLLNLSKCLEDNDLMWYIVCMEVIPAFDKERF